MDLEAVLDMIVVCGGNGPHLIPRPVRPVRIKSAGIASSCQYRRDILVGPCFGRVILEED